MYTKIAVDVPLFYPLTYTVPPNFRGDLRVGQIVQVPFRNRSKTGLVISIDEQLDDPSLENKLKPLVDILELAPLLSEQQVNFLKFVADYYYAPIGEVIRLALPSFVRLEGKKYLEATDKEGAKAELPPHLVHLLDSLRHAEELSLKQLKEMTNDLTYKQILKLEETGFATSKYKQSDGSVRTKTKTLYRIDTDADEAGRLGSKQQKILELLDPEEWLSRKKIRDAVTNPYDSLKRLEQRELIESKTQEVYRNPFRRKPEVEPPKQVTLTDAQSRALDAITPALDADTFQSFVLHGVTGSGKTKVYQVAIEKALRKGQTGLVLLPEIALTPQFVQVFRRHFEDSIAVLHSALTKGERFDQWRKIRNGDVEIVIGARSAIFAPLQNVGVIVVDEEHDSSFKQQQGPRYNARDMALVRGKLESAAVILGGATPSLESYYHAKTERHTYLPMPNRVTDRPLPEVSLIDLREDSPSDIDSNVLSPTLYRALRETLDRNKQAILFLNRRGFSPCVLCETCGHLFKCPNCDVSLTYHRNEASLRCHHCDHAIRMPERCPECQARGLTRKGTGTEKLEGHLNELFPEANIERLDRDKTTGEQIRTTIRAFQNHEIDILAGTQIVTKGHDFPNVVTVGVILADLSLNFPDFRAPERTFQLLTQVAGRAGRGTEPGRVYVQTYNPNHYSLQSAQTHDYETFSKNELGLRRQVGYPPYGHLIALKFRAKNDRHCAATARYYATILRRHKNDHPDLQSDVTVLGPAMAPIARLQGKSRWQILLKSSDRSAVRRLTSQTLSETGYFESANPHKDVQVVVDVDPIDLL